MIYFISCSRPSINYRGTEHFNRPINLVHCTYIKLYQEKIYPDNNGKPAIHFAGIGEEWVFDTVEERDEEMERMNNILSLNGMGEII